MSSAEREVWIAAILRSTTPVTPSKRSLSDCNCPVVTNPKTGHPIPHTHL